MHAELPVLSFICAAILLVFIPLRRVRINIANLSIVSWLLACNLVHGINAIVWAGNVDIRVPVWCDIVTKLLLGATAGVPAGCLCISRHLELISSSRKISLDPTSKRNHRIIDITLCYILPVIYMFLHFIVQDHRFDLVQDFGCSASIHPSTPALIIIWLPPLIICSISFVFAGLAIHNSFRQTSTRFSAHLASRSTMSSSLFIRRLFTSLVTTAVLTVTNMFSMFSPPRIVPWISWASVHSHFSSIDIIKSKEEISSVELTWWGITVVSIIYIILSLAMGEEVRDLVKWIRGQLTQRRSWNSQPVLILHTPTRQPEMVSRSPSLTTPQPQPQEIELKSGWDDMLDAKKPKRTRSKPRTPLPISVTPSPSQSPCPSPSPSPSSFSAEDDAFAVSTLTYLGSPVAQTLGLLTPLASPPPVYTSPQKSVYNTTPWRSPTAAVVPLQQLEKPRFPKPIAEDASSTISSICDAPWPEPPKSVPASPSLSRHSSRSRSHSPSSSGDTFGYPLFPSITPPHLQTRPFQGPSVSPVSSIVGLPKVSRVVSKRPSTRSLRRTWSRDRLQGYTPGDVIYMTVVKESV